MSLAQLKLGLVGVPGRARTIPAHPLPPFATPLSGRRRRRRRRPLQLPRYHSDSPLPSTILFPVNRAVRAPSQNKGDPDHFKKLSSSASIARWMGDHLHPASNLFSKLLKGRPCNQPVRRPPLSGSPTPAPPAWGCDFW